MAGAAPSSTHTPERKGNAATVRTVSLNLLPLHFFVHGLLLIFPIVPHTSTSGPTAAAVCAVSAWHMVAARMCVRLSACLAALAEAVRLALLSHKLFGMTADPFSRWEPCLCFGRGSKNGNICLKVVDCPFALVHSGPSFSFSPRRPLQDRLCFLVSGSSCLPSPLEDTLSIGAQDLTICRQHQCCAFLFYLCFFVLTECPSPKGNLYQALLIPSS